MNKFKYQKRGFTLIELLIVVAVIAILASTVFIAVRGVRESAAISRGLHFSAQVDHALMVNTLAKWPFNEGEGDIVHDTYGEKYDGSIMSLDEGAFWENDSPIKNGHSLRLEGDLFDLIQVTGLTDNKGFQFGGTISLWVKHKGGDSSLLHKAKNVGSPIEGFVYFIKEDNKKACFKIDNKSEVCSADNSVIIGSNKWQHLAVTWTAGGIVKHYVNGESSGAPGTTEPAAKIETGKALLMGVELEGSMTDVKIYSKPLNRSSDTGEILC